MNDGGAFCDISWSLGSFTEYLGPRREDSQCNDVLDSACCCEPFPSFISEPRATIDGSNLKVLDPVDLVGRLLVRMRPVLRC